MSPLLRDLLEMGAGTWSFDELLKAVCPHGVLVGGTYRHFKGDRYKVLGFTRPAATWDGELHVKYVQVDDVEHEATRPLSEFLDDVDKPGYRGPRFKLVGVS